MHPIPNKDHLMSYYQAWLTMPLRMTWKPFSTSESSSTSCRSATRIPLLSGSATTPGNQSPVSSASQNNQSCFLQQRIPANIFILVSRISFRSSVIVWSLRWTPSSRLSRPKPTTCWTSFKQYAHTPTLCLHLYVSCQC